MNTRQQKWRTTSAKKKIEAYLEPDAIAKLDDIVKSNGHSGRPSALTSLIMGMHVDKSPANIDESLSKEGEMAAEIAGMDDPAGFLIGMLVTLDTEHNIKLDSLLPDIEKNVTFVENVTAPKPESYDGTTDLLTYLREASGHDVSAASITSRTKYTKYQLGITGRLTSPADKIRVAEVILADIEEELGKK